jgi:hypothetical protein
MRGALGAVALVGCFSAGEAEPSMVASTPAAPMEMEMRREPVAQQEARSRAHSDDGLVGMAFGGGESAVMDEEDTRGAENKPTATEPSPEGAGQERVRSWFPEAFLWQPRVETGDDGVATLDVGVPDSLTTWRVLALAHDRSGQQAGSVHEFQGTLPLYVDPVVPGWLFAGDRLVMPVQVVNTTAAPVSAALTVQAQGALTGSGVSSVALGAAGSDVRSVALDAVSAGTARISARLVGGEASDAAEREVPVSPAGRPVEWTRTGTLSSSRTFRLAPPDAADPRTDRLEVVVFPAPLALLQLELERLQGGARPLDPAYGFALAARIGELSAAVGVEVDDAAIRRLRVLGWQRIAYAAMAPDPHQAADLLASLRLEEVLPQVTELRPRLVQRVVDGQRADGTWSRSDRSTLAQVLVETAWAARVLPEDQRGARLRASAAVERHLREIDDAYTASVVLASGLADGGPRDQLLGLVRDAIVADEESGERRVDIGGATVRNPWGRRPSNSELLAFAVLALPDGDPDRGDLAAALLRGWSATGGFGAGPADAVALEAVATALGGITGPVTVTLRRDGAEVASGRLDPKQPGVPATLAVEAGALDSEFTVASSPEVPGLAFLATRRSWVPWTEADRLAGVDVAVSTAGLRVGQEGALVLEASAPSGIALRIEQGLPSGTVVADGAAQAAAEIGATLDVRTDRVILTTRPFAALEVQRVELPVIPAFAGRFQTGPLLVAPTTATPVPHRPVVWSVAP